MGSVTTSTLTLSPRLADYMTSVNAHHDTGGGGGEEEEEEKGDKEEKP